MIVWNGAFLDFMALFSKLSRNIRGLCQPSLSFWQSWLSKPWSLIILWCQCLPQQALSCHPTVQALLVQQMAATNRPVTANVAWVNCLKPGLGRLLAFHLTVAHAFPRAPTALSAIFGCVKAASASGWPARKSCHDSEQQEPHGMWTSNGAVPNFFAWTKPHWWPEALRKGSFCECILLTTAVVASPLHYTVSKPVQPLRRDNTVSSIQ
jgi:hypothetical protein